MRRGRLYFVLFLFLVVSGIMAKIYYDTNIFKVEELEITTSKLETDQSFTVLQLTDLHNKQFGDNNEKLLHEIEQLDVDIIVITGDLIDRRTDDLQFVLEFADKLTTINSNIYFVSGNHEWENPLRESFIQGLSKRGIQLIDNQNRIIEIREISFQLAGVADPSTNHDNLELAIKGLNQDDVTVLLSHAPDLSHTEYSEPVNFVLSGHTHGGQIRFPLIGAIVAPDQGFFPKYDQGLFDLNERQQLYIDSGLGTSVIDLRMFNQSQMTLITVKGVGK
ncbi:metallophosphoesterase [Gracilibacillus salitolerans]|uniref:Metallophosphoesterase n=1 Tax=Gracilibacillus salitolerans TaxID=2663022 RepID=A0A5Q2TLP1_9BACI|nr:metallophosphoesterase [Gracilibacillus salitolerans]QGH35002.1 metallophosphoesterase [Gracilibacillus salitolerans]